MKKLVVETFVKGKMVKKFFSKDKFNEAFAFFLASVRHGQPSGIYEVVIKKKPLVKVGLE